MKLAHSWENNDKCFPASTRRNAFHRTASFSADDMYPRSRYRSHVTRVMIYVAYFRSVPSGCIVCTSDTPGHNNVNISLIPDPKHRYFQVDFCSHVAPKVLAKSASSRSWVTQGATGMGLSLRSKSVRATRKQSSYTGLSPNCMFINPMCDPLLHVLQSPLKCDVLLM